MPKYETGPYLVYVFDRYGGRLKDQVFTAGSFTTAREIGREYQGDGSFAVLRVLQNSLDHHPAALYDEDEQGRPVKGPPIQHDPGE
jgi:hypothetical protein